MTLIGLGQIALLALLVTGLAWPLGLYLAAVLEGRRTWGSWLLGWFERLIYRLAGIDPQQEQHWSGYAAAVVAFTLVTMVALLALLLGQGLLPLNPQGLPGLPFDLALNTAISFATNTNWQNYGGETTLSPLSQMVGLTLLNVTSAATGMAVLAALVRGFSRASARTIGNFWVDLVRLVLYLLLPLSAALALGLVALGVPQTLDPAVTVAGLAGPPQTLALGPVASQEAIKLLGTNGGGYFNANSAHPFENPSALSNLIELVALLALPAALLVAFGRLVGDPRQGRALFKAVGLLFLALMLLGYAAESAGSPLLAAAGLDPASANLEGKEIRFGVVGSVLYAVATTLTSCGAVNALHDSLLPLGGLVPLVAMMLGEVAPGGVGSGLYGLLIFVLLTVFIAGLMVGRTPEYLGKKIEAREITLAVLALLLFPLTALGLSALSLVLPAGLASVTATGPHGLSQALYAYTSAAANNGSAFAGYNGNTLYGNLLLGLAMLVGRFSVIVPVLAIAGSLAAKKPVPPSAGTFPTHGGLFVGLLVGVILIVGGLTYFPVLALGPVAEHLALSAGSRF